MTAERESRSRRHLDRFRTALRVTLDGGAFDALDWSAGGFAIAPAGRDWTPGRSFQARLAFPVNNVFWGFDAMVEVVHVASDRVGFHFRDLTPDQIEDLHRMRLACIGGRIMDLETLIDRPQAYRLDAPAESQARPRRRWLPLALVLALGPVVFGAVLVMLHDRLLTVRASHAAVTVPALRVRMPVDGVVRRLLVGMEERVPAGAVLFGVADDELAAQIELADADLLRHTAAVEAMRRRHTEITAFFADYVDLATAAVGRAAAAEEQAARALVLAEREQARIADLHATGHVAQTRMDEVLGKVASARKALLAARGDLDQARANLRMARDGRYYTGSRVEGGEPARLAEDIQRAEVEHGLRSRELAALMERRAALSVTSPCDCEVVARPVQPGEWLRAGSEVYVLKPADAAPVLTAKVTHAQARLLRVGGEAVLRRPTDDTVWRGRVEAISHAVAANARYGLPARIEEDDAFATVAVSLPGEAAAPPGTPAIVTFPLDWATALADWAGLALRCRLASAATC